MSISSQAFEPVPVRHGDTLAKIAQRMLPHSSKAAQSSAIREFFRLEGVGTNAKYIPVSNPNSILSVLPIKRSTFRAVRKSLNVTECRHME